MNNRGYDGDGRQRGVSREKSDDSAYLRQLVEGDQISFDDKLDENDLLQGPLHGSKGDFSLHNSRNGEYLSSSKASMSFNNSMADEGAFGVFEYEPESNMRHSSSLSDHSAWVEREDLKGSLHGHGSTNDTYAQQGSVSREEPVRPPSRHQQPLDQAGYGSFRLSSNQDSETSIYGSSDYNSQQTHASFEGSLGQLNVPEVSAEDIRQRQMNQQMMQQQHPGSPQMQLMMPQSQQQQHLGLHQQQQIFTPQMGQQQQQPVDLSQQQQIYQQDHQHNNFGHANFQMNPQQQQQPQHVPMMQEQQTSGVVSGLSQSLHGTPFSQQQQVGQSSPFHPGNNGATSPMANTGSFYQRQPQGVSHSFPGLQGNISIANENPTSKPMFGNMGSLSSSKPAVQNGDVAAAMSEAMEKLSDSMKRTAMSRSMVKQFSGRGLVQHSSARALLGKQSSFRMVGGQRPSRAVAQQLSDRNLMVGGDTGRTPLRRTNSKHHLQHPNRVFRHDSQRSLNQSGHNSISFQLDTRNVGGF